MNQFITVILPVFLVVGAGYLVSWRGWFDEHSVDVLMRFAQDFALPVLLLQSIARMDLSAQFDVLLLLVFYAGAFASFLAGWSAAKYLFRRPPMDCVSIGFVALFSNTLLLGVPITERAYGEAALAGNWIIVSTHSPLIYTFGITLMEFTRTRGLNLSLGRVASRALGGVLRTPLVMGILGGFAVNLAGIFGFVLPGSVQEGMRMIAMTALPTALFALGGILVRYRPAGDMGLILICCAASLLLHPAITFGLGRVVGLDLASMRSAVMTAAMAPGVNAYIFAHMYGVGKRVAASSLLLATGASVLTIGIWLAALG